MPRLALVYGGILILAGLKQHHMGAICLLCLPLKKKCGSPIMSLATLEPSGFLGNDGNTIETENSGPCHQSENAATGINAAGTLSHEADAHRQQPGPIHGWSIRRHSSIVDLR